MREGVGPEVAATQPPTFPSSKGDSCAGRSRLVSSFVCVCVVILSLSGFGLVSVSRLVCLFEFGGVLRRICGCCAIFSAPVAAAGGRGGCSFFF